jgi:alpha-methylacyl-CoA racemase
VLNRHATGQGVYLEVALSSAASYLALPRAWGLTAPGAAIGGGHAGYQIYACKNARVAVAALEPHFAARLCAAAGLGSANMHLPSTHQAIADWLLGKTRAQLDKLAASKDIPLHTFA